MRLNFDCVRDILLCVEENTDLRRFCYFVNLDADDVRLALGTGEPEVKEYQKQLDMKYENGTLIYHVLYCIDAELVHPLSEDRTEIYIADLTVSGHELIGKIREPEPWDKTKGICKALGASSLRIVESVAEGVATALLNKMLSLS